MADDRGSGVRLLIVGPPGSGKGTQSALLAERLSVPAISTGEMLRRAVDEGSELGRRVEAILASGELVDDDTMADVVESRLAQPDARRGFLLDGYPRTLGQAETLQRILGEIGAAIDAVVYFDVPREVLIERLTARARGGDDRRDVVEERLRVYREWTAPLVEHYLERGLLMRVDGNRPVETIAEGLASSLEDLASSLMERV